MALVCSMSLFTACSDDEEPWENIPKTEITTESGNLAVKVNGETSANGSVKVTAKNASEAVTTLKNIVPGYAEVDIDVELEEQADKSFRFVGSKELYTAPALTKETLSQPGLMTVEVSGTIDLEGKASVDVTAYGPGLHVGSYDGSNLVLTYSGSELTGATVVYSIVQDAPVLTLGGVIPGEQQASIAGVYPAKDGSFSGEATTAGGTTVKYSGQMSVATGVLTLNVDATLSSSAQGELAGTWNLLTYYESVNSVLTKAPLWITWSALDTTAKNAETLAYVANVFGSGLLYQYLNQVTFSADGNITAQYFAGEIDDLMTAIFSSMGEDENGTPCYINTHPDQPWSSSPKNLAFWYVKDGYLWIVPNITAILKQVGEDNGGEAVDMGSLTDILASLGEYGIDITPLLNQVMEWLQTGIPVRYEAAANGLKIYVDKEMAAPFINALLPALPVLDQKIAELIATDPDNGFMIQMLFGMLGIDNFAELADIWNSNTDQFEIALNFDRN